MCCEQSHLFMLIEMKLLNRSDSKKHRTSPDVIPFCVEQHRIYILYINLFSYMNNSPELLSFKVL